MMAEDSDTTRIYKRFYAALQLRDLCNEMPIHAVARKYDMPRGAIQNLAQTCHGFAAGMIKFCERMKWGILAAALDHMSDRLKAGMYEVHQGPRVAADDSRRPRGPAFPCSSDIYQKPHSQDILGQRV